MLTALAKLLFPASLAISVNVYGVANAGVAPANVRRAQMRAAQRRATEDSAETV